MASFASVIRDANVSSLHRVVDSSGDKYLCFTRFSSALIVSVTDGVALWRTEVDDEELEALRDLAGVTTPEAYLHKFRNGFNNGDLSLSVVGNKVTLTVGKGATTLSIDLYEAKAADKKAELQRVLFRLAEAATSLDSELVKAKETIDYLKAQKGAAGGAQAFMDLGPKKSPVKAKPKRTTGMSVLNPTSKKRKAAHGVVFD